MIREIEKELFKLDNSILKYCQFKGIPLTDGFIEEIRNKVGSIIANLNRADEAFTGCNQL